jgi:hypothetical protein
MAISAWGSKDEGCEYYESAKSESYRHSSSWLKIEFDRLDPIDPGVLPSAHDRATCHHT